jgi:hypothetical protein
LRARKQVVREQMDPENCIEEEYRHNNDTCWRWVTLRMLAAYDIRVFSAATAQNRFIEGAVNMMDGKDVKETDKMEEEEGKGGEKKEGEKKEEEKKIKEEKKD